MQSKKITINVSHIADLARLPLSDDQITKLQTQLASIISYVQQLDTVSTESIQQTAQVTGRTNVFRDDVIEPCLSQKEALKNAPETYNGYFKVRSVFEK